jgi:hypothetical protein
VSGSIDNTLRVWNIESGVCLLELVLAGPVHSFAIFSDLGLTGTETGEVSILELKDLILGRPIITIVRLWLFDLQAWDANLTTRCLWCGNSFLPDETVLEIINKFGSQLSPGQSPCMALASETWDDPRLISECPHCHKPLKYNPFIIDNRSKDDSL